MAVIQQDGSTLNVVLEDYKLVLGLWTNLFSITKALESDWNIGNKGNIIYMTKRDMKIKFDKMIDTKHGCVYGVEMRPRNLTHNENGVLTLIEGKNMNVNKLHEVLGHAGEDVVRRTGNYYGINVVGKFTVCEDCAKAKSKKKTVNTETINHSTKSGERLCNDQSPIKMRSFGGSKHWLLIVDEYTGKCWSYFLKEKTEQIEKIVNLIWDLRMKLNI